MKIRNGFVSNSSSSSFIIYKSDLTMEEFEQIKDHEEVAGSDSWCVDDTERDFVRFSTHMDNFSLYLFQIFALRKKKNKLINLKLLMQWVMLQKKEAAPSKN